MFEQKITQPTIETPRLQLRPLLTADAAMLRHYASEQSVARMTTSIPHPLPDGATEAFLDAVQADDRIEDAWAIDGSDTGLPALLGVIGLERLDRQQSEIGYWVAPQFWNSGVESEAVGAIVNANPHGARTMFGAVFQDNPASVRVLEKVGFEYLGPAEAYSVARGEVVPTWTYLRKLN